MIGCSKINESQTQVIDRCTRIIALLFYNMSNFKYMFNYNKISYFILDNTSSELYLTNEIKGPIEIQIVFSLGSLVCLTGELKKVIVR